jgi:hypothetical protein
MLRLLLSLQPVFFGTKFIPSAECLQKHQAFWGGGGEGGGGRLNPAGRRERGCQVV